MSVKDTIAAMRGEARSLGIKLGMSKLNDALAKALYGRPYSPCVAAEAAGNPPYPSWDKDRCADVAVSYGIHEGSLMAVVMPTVTRLRGGQILIEDPPELPLHSGRLVSEAFPLVPPPQEGVTVMTIDPADVAHAQELMEAVQELPLPTIKDVGMDPKPHLLNAVVAHANREGIFLDGMADGGFYDGILDRLHSTLKQDLSTADGISNEAPQAADAPHDAEQAKGADQRPIVSMADVVYRNQKIYVIDPPMLERGRTVGRSGVHRPLDPISFLKELREGSKKAGAIPSTSHGKIDVDVKGSPDSRAPGEPETASVPDGWPNGRPARAMYAAATQQPTVGNMKERLDKIRDALQPDGSESRREDVQAQPYPNCGACPGDGSLCQNTCKLDEESPPMIADTNVIEALRRIVTLDEEREYGLLTWREFRAAAHKDAVELIADRRRKDLPVTREELALSRIIELDAQQKKDPEKWQQLRQKAHEEAAAILGIAVKAATAP